jgi:pentatricopeptide repeat protein
MNAYNIFKQSGASLLQDLQNTLISLVAGLGEQGSGSYPIREKEPPHDIESALSIFDDTKQNNIELFESSYTALIRCSCLNGLLDKAMEFFNELKEKALTPRMRTYTPLIYTSSAMQNSKLCFDLYKEAVVRYNLVLGEKDYVSLLKLCVATNDNRFYNVLTQFTEDILIPNNSEVWDVISSWFSSNGRESRFEVSVRDVNSETGEVLPSGQTLLSIGLTENNRKLLLYQISDTVFERENQNNNTLTSVESQSEEPTKNEHPSTVKETMDEEVDRAIVTTEDGAKEEMKRQYSNNSNSDKKKKIISKSWESFHKWLYYRTVNTGIQQQHELNKDVSVSDNDDVNVKTVVSEAKEISYLSYDTFNYRRNNNVIIDGANVGYYQQNYAGAPKHVDYLQIDSMVRYLQGMNKNIILILHCRHLSPNLIPKDVCDVIERWKKCNILYVTPAGCNDDWFWLYGAVLLRCDVVTNDEMRDHHFRMLSPRFVIYVINVINYIFLTLICSI